MSKPIWKRRMEMLFALRYKDSEGKDITEEVLDKLDELGIYCLCVGDIENLIKRHIGKKEITNQDIAKFVMDSKNYEDLIRLGFEKDSYDTWHNDLITEKYEKRGKTSEYFDLIDLEDEEISI
ncbi:MAG: hypothetical protein IJN50_00205 [Clostridia bacterium]|nr:hypothetical protein [Clostridia bacterium]